MKTLSLKQPFAELILQGRKTIELRKWRTSFQGEFLIHASKNPDEESMRRFGFTNLPCGFIVGKATLVDVKNYDIIKDFELDKDKHLADKNWGGFGFILKDAKRINPIIPARGQLNFWDFDEKLLHSN